MNVYRLKISTLLEQADISLVVRTIRVVRPKSWIIFSDTKGDLFVKTNKRPLNDPTSFIWWENIDPDLEAQILEKVRLMDEAKSRGDHQPEPDQPVGFLPCECGEFLSVSNWGDVTDCPQCEKPGYSLEENDGN